MKPLNYVNNPEIGEKVDYFLTSHSSLLTFLQFTQADLKELIEFMFSVVETPESLSGLLLIEPSVRYLLISACIEAGKNLGEIKKLVKIEKALRRSLKCPLCAQIKCPFHSQHPTHNKNEKHMSVCSLAYETCN